ncbi:conserved hypothetical protein [Roseovarius sp. EC-HK134]|uniref:ChbG/HpnK family deacetylase n=1 Tax=unclassified Roseovarius TaxID=2614913 RepID=UPI0012550503|nr:MULTISPECIES: ChbG/HpnK family deacetylase [unclassified Roseovarius]VVT17520.1 conserved hypothetical protein [Roseovarius sp. EC-HK134]VVT17949.1 conserved hypothetical protein [Roseovarius sp. EC-SD190]
MDKIIETPMTWGGRIHLCADDFGLNAAVDEGILDLVHLGRLTAVSCMAGGVEITRDIPRLLAAVSDAPWPVQIGLHVTLTEYTTLGPIRGLAPECALPGIGTVMRQAYLRRLDVPAIRMEIDRQMACLSALMGRVPDFVDGHQHVHLLPGIRDAVAASWKDWSVRPGWVRYCGAPERDLAQLPSAQFKSRVLSLMSRAAAPSHDEAGMVTNPRFFGVTEFSPEVPFGPRMRRWLSLANSGESGALIMCHPGRASVPAAGDPPDPIHLHRPQELAYLASEAFLTDLAETGVATRFGL